MKTVYITPNGIEHGNGQRIDVPHQTVAAARRGRVTIRLRRAVRAALDECVVLEHTKEKVGS